MKNKLLIIMSSLVLSGSMLSANSTFEDFQNRFNSFQDNFFKNKIENNINKFNGTIIFEKDGFKIIEIELAGFNKKDILIKLKNKSLIVDAKYNKDNINKDYKNSIYIGSIEGKEIISEYKNGLLTIKIPINKIKEEIEEIIEIIEIIEIKEL